VPLDYKSDATNKQTHTHTHTHTHTLKIKTLAVTCSLQIPNAKEMYGPGEYYHNQCM